MFNKIPFNKLSTHKEEKILVNQVFKNQKFADGPFQKKCKFFIQRLIKSKSIEITQSCSSALEASMLLINLKKNDEVIMPSYTFTSTANAVLLRGATPVFADISYKDANLDIEEVKKKINKNTRAILLVHYAGIACDMDDYIKLTKDHNLYLIEDAAHAFLGKFKNKYLGTIGDFGAFSFHETKNYIGGQCGALSINNKKFIKKASIILDKGTDRSFVADKKKFYSWYGIGSEYRAAELPCALLLGQLKNYKKIYKSRRFIWLKYFENFTKLKSDKFSLLEIGNKFKNNAYHIFAIIFKNLKMRNSFINYMNKNNITCYFHYYPLHMSKFGRQFSKNNLINTKKVYNGLVRLPLYTKLKKKEVTHIIDTVKKFLKLN
jgi:dTDP-4-amino-4,6-dideoxygalactose transaminase